jgi:putative hemolysin
MDVIFVLTLILLNGVFAMSEIAVVSSRRARLQQMAESGRKGAVAALALSAEPTRFLSSVQVGITAIGILSGAIGEAVFASRLSGALGRVPLLAPYADALALAVIVLALTYVSLILGELVPKRLALTNPERIASLIARPMQVLATIGRPIVHVLSASTDGVLRLLQVRGLKQPAVTPDEIRLLLEQATEEGVVERSEQEMVSNVLNLDDRHVESVLTPRSDIVFLDLHEPADAVRHKLRSHNHAVVPVCDGGLEHVVGFAQTIRVMEQLVDHHQIDLRSVIEPALFVPETMTLMKLLEQFKRTHLPVALVVDEFGAVEGLVSLTDVISAIVGDLPLEPDEDPAIVRRDDGSLLLDGALDLETVARALGTPGAISPDDRRHYNTLGGLAMLALGRVPRTGDVFVRGGYRFEVMDMDGNRVDRLLVTAEPTAAGHA